MNSRLLLLVTSLSGCADLPTANMIDSVSTALSDSTNIVIDRAPPFPIIPRWYQCEPIGEPCGDYFALASGDGVRPWLNPPAWMVLSFDSQTHFWKTALVPSGDFQLEVKVFRQHAPGGSWQIAWGETTDPPWPIHFIVSSDLGFCEDPDWPRLEKGCYRLNFERIVRWQITIARQQWRDRHIVVPSITADGELIEALYLDAPETAALLRTITDGLWTGSIIPLREDGWDWHGCFREGAGSRRGGDTIWHIESRPHRSLLTFAEINPAIQWFEGSPEPWWRHAPAGVHRDSLPIPAKDSANFLEVLSFADRCPRPTMSSRRSMVPVSRTMTLPIPATAGLTAPVSRIPDATEATRAARK